LRAIEGVLADMADPKPMDWVVCGDVGFGKTEVAMRAAFVAADGGRQVAVLVPTTLLAQQHFENFSDRFADWPIKVESLSRFRTAKEQKVILDGLANSTLDIVVGTHKLLQPSVKFKNLGLVIIDEEHRFGVRHKEQMKLEQLIPEARVQVAHGQLRERDLERIMRDFYHQRFNLLVCATILDPVRSTTAPRSIWASPPSSRPITCPTCTPGWCSTSASPAPKTRKN
jgi:transcription-repair coupling factor (superfamily II helicase)